MCRYLLRVTIARAYGGSMVQDVQLWVRNYEEPIEEVTPPIKARRPPSGPLSIAARSWHAPWQRT